MTAVSALLTACFLLLPSVAAPVTDIPDPAQCVVPEVIVGCTSGAPCGVLVRDTNGDPMPGVLVELWFAPAIPYGQDLSVWNTQIPPATQTCATYTISMLTNEFGLAAFEPLFGGHVNAPLVEVLAEGIPLGAAMARSTDFNGDGMCCAIDLAWFRHYYWYEPEAEQANFNNQDQVDLADLEIFRKAYFAGFLAAPCP